MNIKTSFPIFKSQPELVYLDSAATSLKPQVVIDALNEYYQDYSANIHRGVYSISEKATDKYEEARAKIATFIGSNSPEQVIFTSGATAGLNMIARSFEEKLEPGHEIIIPVSEHHSNFLPWQRLAGKTSADLRAIPESDLNPDKISKHISQTTKILSFAHVSNVLGGVRNINDIVLRVREINPDIIIVVDGAQAIPHLKVDIEELGVDFYVFSGHKMYGPTGIGVTWASQSSIAQLEPLSLGGGMVESVTKKDYSLLKAPAKYEAGTPPIAEAIGLAAAADFLDGIDYQHTDLSQKLYEEVAKLPFIKVLGAGSTQIPLVSFVIEKIHGHDVAGYLAERNICVRAGHHCAMPLHAELGVSASVRASLGAYNDDSDIEKLVTTLKDCYRDLVEND